HGEAVALGLALVLRFCAGRNLIAAAEVARVARHLDAVGLPTRLAQVQGGAPADADRLMALMGQDKKVRRGRMTFILARAIGQAFIADDVDEGDVRRFLDAELASP
ncbi:MAG: 3-dehydroquinate synthase, partial [Proteobacteria bacterium]|nr:3-dehydroquinate synthase [Pseudomonadota bacterium]